MRGGQGDGEEPCSAADEGIGLNANWDEKFRGFRSTASGTAPDEWQGDRESPEFPLLIQDLPMAALA